MELNELGLLIVVFLSSVEKYPRSEVIVFEKEREMLNKQWALESQKEQDLEHQRFVLNRERNIELIQFNEEERKLKVQ